VLQSLTGALGESATAGAAQRTPAGALGASALRTWLLGGLGALAIGAGAVVAVHPWSQPSRVAAPVASSSPAPGHAPPDGVPTLSVDDLQSLPRMEGASASPRPRLSTASPPPDSLPEEVRLLSKAEQQLHGGHADDALRTLGEHERRFPGGFLAEERLAARVQALCALGRTAEAKADLAKLTRTNPGSANFDRARRFCDLDSP
jgi:hypothetical protein